MLRCQTLKISRFVVAPKLEGVLEQPFAIANEGRLDCEKKLAVRQPSLIQDLLRWNKAVRRLSTQKYIAMCAYIFFCICKNVSVKLTVVINLIMSLIIWPPLRGRYDQLTPSFRI